MIAEQFGLQFSQRRDGGYRVDTPCSPLGILIEDDGPNDRILTYAYFRTRSADWAGERTDLNDSLSLLCTAFFQAIGFASCQVTDIPNQFSMIPGELYARYLTFGDAHGSIFHKGKEAQRALVGLFSAYRQMEVMAHNWIPFWHAEEPMDDCDMQGYGILNWAHAVCEALGDSADFRNDLWTQRESTGWRFYRTADGSISVISCTPLFDALHRMTEAPRTILPGVTGSLFIDGPLGNYVGTPTSQRLDRLVNALNSEAGITGSAKVDLLPVENNLIALSEPWIISMAANCSFRLFKEERLRVLQRNKQESALLAPPGGFEWVEAIPDDRFEQLIHALLLEEPGVNRVYQVAPTRERDGGRDLIAEWVTPLLPSEQAKNDSAPARARKVVVQCKVRKRSVGRRDLDQGVLDTLYMSRADGYFLAASTQLSSSVTDLLDQIGERGDYYVNWWGRVEIEERLRKNPDVLRRFSDIVQGEPETGIEGG
jgi:hypothetical protein